MAGLSADQRQYFIELDGKDRLPLTRQSIGFAHLCLRKRHFAAVTRLRERD